MFKVGDFVKLLDIPINENLLIKKNERYKIHSITYSEDGSLSGFYLEGFIHTPYYNKRFELDLKYMRSKKIKKLEDICSK